MVYGVSQTFHPVGNGTLFTGRITWDMSAPGPSSHFTWVYDCGSTSEKSICDSVDYLPLWFGAAGTDIDMLVISHFDDDHVNGLEALLDKHYVKKLVLPYTEWVQSIREISVMGQKGTSPSVALFQLNPARWIEVKNKENRIGEIVLVQGNGGPDYSGPEPDSFLPDDPDWVEGSIPESDRDQDVISTDDSGSDSEFDYDAADSAFMEIGRPVHQSGITVTRIHQNHPLRNACNTFEFMFYNAEKSLQGLNLVEVIGGKTCAKKSGIELTQVKVEIDTLIGTLGLDGDVRSMPVNWRARLKACYEKHFGHSSKARNNISLCMYAGPVGRTQFRFFPRYAMFPFQPSILMTGDINLNPYVIDDMQRHFGPFRWNRLGVIQVPHHGSCHCWNAGNTRHFRPANFVQCATGTKHHPHADVTYDLLSHGASVFHADRSTSVNFGYFYKQVR